MCLFFFLAQPTENMDFLDLKNFNLVFEENGNVKVVDGEVVLQEILTRKFFLAPFQEVASFYNLQQEQTNANAEAGEVPNRTNEEAAVVPNENLSEIFKWSDEQTELLLELYDENYKLVGPLKKHRNKKQMWSFIAEAFLYRSGVRVTPDQVEGRFKTVVKKTKLILKNNGLSGAVRKDIPFSLQMNKIIQCDDSIFPEVFIGPNRMVKKNEMPLHQTSLPSTSRRASSPSQISGTSPSTSSENRSPNMGIAEVDGAEDSTVESPPARKKQKCFNERMVLMLIKDKERRSLRKEENKDKRHKERMELFAEHFRGSK